MKAGRKTAETFCPDCEEQIHMSHDPELGLSVVCPHCWAYLEVIRLKPLKLSWDIRERMTGWRVTKTVVVN